MKELVIFGRSALSCLHLTLTFRTAKNLCPTLKKPPLPSKISDYRPVATNSAIAAERYTSTYWRGGEPKVCVELRTYFMEGPQDSINLFLSNVFSQYSLKLKKTLKFTACKVIKKLWWSISLLKNKFLHIYFKWFFLGSRCIFLNGSASILF